MDSNEYYEKLIQARIQKENVRNAQSPLYLELLKVLNLDIDDHLSIKTVTASSWNDSLKNHLKKMLDEPRTIHIAFFVLNCLLQSDPQLKDDLTDFLPAIKRNLLSDKASISALESYFYFDPPDFKQVVISLLEKGRKDFYLFYIMGKIGTEEDVPILMKFSGDQEYGETEGMGGPWRFYYRDAAFEAIEKISGVKILKADSSTLMEGRKTSYYDWAPIRDWWESRVKDKRNKNGRFL